MGRCLQDEKTCCPGQGLQGNEKKPAGGAKALPEQGNEGNGCLPAEGKVKAEPKSPAKPQRVKLEVASRKTAPKAAGKEHPKIGQSEAEAMGHESEAQGCDQGWQDRPA